MEPTGLPDLAEALDPAIEIRSFGLRMLLRLRRPVYFLARRGGRGGLRRRRNRESTLIRATPAVSEKSTTFVVVETRKGSRLPPLLQDAGMTRCILRL